MLGPTISSSMKKDRSKSPISSLGLIKRQISKRLPSKNSGHIYHPNKWTLSKREIFKTPQIKSLLSLFLLVWPCSNRAYWSRLMSCIIWKVEPLIIRSWLNAWMNGLIFNIPTARTMRWVAIVIFWRILWLRYAKSRQTTDWPVSMLWIFLVLFRMKSWIWRLSIRNQLRWVTFLTYWDRASSSSNQSKLSKESSKYITHIQSIPFLNNLWPHSRKSYLRSSSKCIPFHSRATELLQMRQKCRRMVLLLRSGSLNNLLSQCESTLHLISTVFPCECQWNLKMVIGIYSISTHPINHPRKMSRAMWLPIHNSKSSQLSRHRFINHLNNPSRNPTQLPKETPSTSPLLSWGLPSSTATSTFHPHRLCRKINI